MRFNGKELSYLAQEPSAKFDKEGYLLMKDKPDRLFKKGEVYLERWFRLRGNLLFYFKSKDMVPKTEPMGVLVLERCTVDLDVSEEVSHSFLLNYEGETNVINFAAKTEDECQSWIQALHIASYECLKLQLQSLREQIWAKTGQDPTNTKVIPVKAAEVDLLNASSNDDPALEICIACEALPSDSSCEMPNPFVVLYTMIPPQENWVQHDHTEIIENCGNPQFLKTIGFGDRNGVTTCMRVKLTVYHIKERMTATMNQIGHAVFTLQDVLIASDMKISLSLKSPDFGNAGSVTIMAWINEHATAIVDLQEDQADAAEVGSKGLTRKRSVQLDIMRSLYNNIISRTFRFDTMNARMKLLVHEFLGESRLSFSIPIQYLKILISEERDCIDQLQNLGELLEEVNCYRSQMTDFNMSSISGYTQTVRYLASYKGPCFKHSTKKADKELEFVPVNLHIQGMLVNNEAKNTVASYDITTVGAFSAYSQKYKPGGLNRMLTVQRQNYSPESTLGKKVKMDTVCDIRNDLMTLKQAINSDCDRLCHAALRGSATELRKRMDIVMKKVNELVQVSREPVLDDALKIYSRYKPDPSRSSDSILGSSKAYDASPEKNWKWTGSVFVKSPTVEPWDMTQLNVEASVVCATSMVDDLIQNKSDARDISAWLGHLSPVVIQLKSFIEILCKRAILGMVFLTLWENKGNLQLMHTIKYRRDIVFCHALTSIVSAFATKLRTNVHNVSFLKQLSKVGIYAEFEGLLSCHGDEIGMLEDMMIAVEDLINVSFSLKQAESVEEIAPIISRKSTVKKGTFRDIHRSQILATIPIPAYMFQKLTPDLQQGQEIKVTCSFFNVGINEQATLAEKFGSTSLQEDINKTGLKNVFDYYSEYKDVMGDPDHHRVGAGSVSERHHHRVGAGSVAELIQQLQYNVLIKKSKNVEILQVAAELCRKLNGMRFTSCKSAKDRTSMGVTLEQVQILQQDHDLAPHVFTQALDCMRSEGVRRENTMKNTGVKKYAFNSLQLLYVPKLYRPPNGTYGNVAT